MKQMQEKGEKDLKQGPKLKSFRPVTPGQRHKVQRDLVLDGVQEVPKELRHGVSRTGGRNHRGRITCRHRGAVSSSGKKVLRRVTSLSPLHDVRILGIQWDPRRTAPVALVVDQKTGESFYILAGEGMRVGQRLRRTQQVGILDPNGLDASEIGPNVRCRRSLVPMGTLIYDLARNPLHPQRSTRVKTAGSSARVLRHEDQRQRTRIRLPSGEERRVPESAYATIGQVAAKDHRLETIGKAGTRRRCGIRPTVRGCAMNPIDHPHGGRTKGGRHDVTPWAKIAKGQPTRMDRHRSSFVVKTSRTSQIAARSR